MTEENRSSRPLWLVRPAELAERFSFDVDELMSAIDPEDLPDWQLAVAFEALELCRGWEGSDDPGQLGPTGGAMSGMDGPAPE